MIAVELGYSEIFSQPHQMFAEGTCYSKPQIIDVERFLLERDWFPIHVDIWWDSDERLWRWYTPIKAFVSIGSIQDFLRINAISFRIWCNENEQNENLLHQRTLTNDELYFYYIQDKHK